MSVSQKQSSNSIRSPYKIKPVVKAKQIQLEDITTDTTERRVTSTDDEVVESTRNQYLKRVEEAEIDVQRKLDREEQDRLKEITRKVRSKKLRNKIVTFDYNGHVLIVQDPLKDIQQSQQDVDNPALEIRDQGITDSKLIHKLKKIKFRNDGNFLEDYLSWKDAKRFMEFTEEEYKTEWFSKIPEIIEPEDNFRVEDHIHVSRGVKVKSRKGESLLKNEPEHFDHKMTLQDYYTLSSEQQLTDRFKNYDMLKTCSPSDNDKINNSQIRENNEIGQESVKSNSVTDSSVQCKASRYLLNTPGSTKSRNFRYGTLSNKISCMSANALKTLDIKSKKDKKYTANSKFYKTQSHGVNRRAQQSRATTPQILYQDFIAQNRGRRNLRTRQSGYRTHRSLRSTVGSTTSSLGQMSPSTYRYIDDGFSPRTTVMKKSPHQNMPKVVPFLDVGGFCSPNIGSPSRLLTSQSKSRGKMSSRADRRPSALYNH